MAFLRCEVALPRDRFTLEVAATLEGSGVGIFGPSGAGKSSLLEVLAGLDRGARGRIEWLGSGEPEPWLDSERGHRLPPESRGLGYVPQEGLLFPHLDVRANLLAGAERARRRGLDVAATLDDLGRRLEIEALFDRRPATLSGGERQRVALARAICSGPKLLLLDEPLAALDLPLRRRLLPLLRQVRERLGLPWVLVSHDPTEIQALCDQVLVLHAGRQVALGPTREVLADPEVFPLAREQGFENLLPAVVEASDGRVSTVRLGESSPHSAGQPARQAPRLVVPGGDHDPGHSILVGIPAREILLAKERPRGLSARNIVPAKVESVRDAAGLRLVSTRLDGAPGLPAVLVEITREAEQELALGAGQRIYLILKTMGCTVFA